MQRIFLRYKKREEIDCTNANWTEKEEEGEKAAGTGERETPEAGKET